MILLNVFYYVTLIVLKLIMDKRDPINPRKFMIFYNFICVCLATYSFGGKVYFYYLKGNAITCQNVNFDSTDSHWIAHVYFFLFFLLLFSLFIFIMFKSIGNILILSYSS